MPFFLREMRTHHPSASRRQRAADTPARARRAVAGLILAAEILVVAWTGAGSVTFGCRLGPPFDSREVGITFWSGAGGRAAEGRHTFVHLCAAPPRLNGGGVTAVR